MKWRADKKGCGAITSGGNTIAKGIYSFTASQKNDLIRIGGQCPMIGGNAVFKARSMLTLVNNELFYDDFDICNAAGIALKFGQASIKTAIHAKVYPNPTNSIATLEYLLNDGLNATFNLFSINGQVLLNHNLVGDRGTFTFDTNFLESGIYFYKINSDKSGVLNGKLIIIR